jgi:hypothetical protein
MAATDDGGGEAIGHLAHELAREQATAGHAGRIHPGLVDAVVLDEQVEELVRERDVVLRRVVGSDRLPRVAPLLVATRTARRSGGRR